jgi:hypothetical protein
MESVVHVNVSVYLSETSLYHLVFWYIEGEMVITTKISSVKLLILRGDRTLDLQRSLYIYIVSTVSHNVVRNCVYYSLRNFLNIEGRL